MTVVEQIDFADVIGVDDTAVCHMGFLKDRDANAVILHRRYAARRRRDQG